MIKVVPVVRELWLIELDAPLLWMRPVWLLWTALFRPVRSLELFRRLLRRNPAAHFNTLYHSVLESRVN